MSTDTSTEIMAITTIPLKDIKLSTEMMTAEDIYGNYIHKPTADKVVITKDGTFTGQNVTLVGSYSNISGDNSTGIGASVNITSANSTAIGYGANVLNAYSTVLGASATTFAESSTALGAGASTGGVNSTALGKGASTRDGMCNVAVGTGANMIGGSYSTSIGYQATTTGDYSVSIGSNASVTGNNSISICGNLSGDNTFQVWDYKLLDKTTGLIPAERLGNVVIDKSKILEAIDANLSGISATEVDPSDGTAIVTALNGCINTLKAIQSLCETP